MILCSNAFQFKIRIKIKSWSTVLLANRCGQIEPSYKSNPKTIFGQFCKMVLLSQMFCAYVLQILDRIGLLFWKFWQIWATFNSDIWSLTRLCNRPWKRTSSKHHSPVTNKNKSNAKFFCSVTWCIHTEHITRRNTPKTWPFKI